MSSDPVIMPGAKVGKSYPISYFTQVNDHFRPESGVFTYKGWKFERVGRNQVKVLEIPEQKEDATSA